VTNPIHQCLGEDLVMRVDNDAVVLSDANTTVGYARFSKFDRTVDYIFVHPSFRRKGIGRRLVAQCEQECGCRLCPAPPLSPLGRKLFSGASFGDVSSDDIAR
jgi:GNAT superfamily N-acetyltransferase